MSKISDEIREFVRRSYADEHMDPRELLALADRADAEMVELPKDADGLPIHVGDTVYLDDGGKAEVTRIDLMPTKTCIVCWTSDKKDVAYLPPVISHKPADSWERIADELVRCKDCVHHDERGYMPGRVMCRMHSGIWGNDDFCSKAEKRED